MCGMCHVQISMYGPYFEAESTVYLRPRHAIFTDWQSCVYMYNFYWLSIFMSSHVNGEHTGLISRFKGNL